MKSQRFGPRNILLLDIGALDGVLVLTGVLRLRDRVAGIEDLEMVVVVVANVLLVLNLYHMQHIGIKETAENFDHRTSN